ncbi:DUF4386 domain-containing protein [Candidatus Cloacimonadota bacterium]
MNPERKIAIIVGILFLVALIFNIVAMPIYQPILNAEDFLTNAYPAKIKIIIGILIDFICIPAIVLIPIMLFPILKKYNESLALGYVVFRAIEGVMFILSLIGYMSLLSLSKIYLSSGLVDSSYYQAIGNSIKAGNCWLFLMYITFFAFGAMILNYLLYKSKLVPRFISIWGFAAALFMLTGAVIGMFGIFDPIKIMTVCGPPIGLNEFVLLFWLLIKGFNKSESILNTISKKEKL